MRRFLVGTRISLHGLAPEQLRADAPYYGWLDDLSLDLFTGRSDFPNNPQRMSAYYESACANDRLILLGIFENSAGRHIGNVTLQEVDWVHRRAYLGYLIGEKEFSGKGLASEACLMTMYYGFNKLNFERIWTTVTADNLPSARVAEKVGFTVEGIMRGHLLRNGTRRDVTLLGALREEWMTACGERALAVFAEPPV
jgi:[ribosomal protein S5]-alanine N-acetyltransferase